MVRCKYCKGYFPREECIRVGPSSFCSEEHRSAHFMGQAQSRGTAAAHRRRLSKVPPQVEQRVKKADRQRCRLCGRTYGLAVHHINYRSEPGNKPWMNEPWNLVLLCNHCHIQIIHHDKKRWKPICLLYTWFRETEGRLYSFEQLEAMIAEMSSVDNGSESLRQGVSDEGRPNGPAASGMEGP